jgi:hypothetical protein
MRHLVYIVGITMLLLGCAEPAPEVRPSIVLDQDKFTEVMVDVSLVQAAYTRGLAEETPSETREKSYEHYAEVWAKYGIDAEIFKASFAWYITHEVLMVEVYEEVLERLATIAEE